MIGLMDCNNFFVSCERLFRPDLIGKPVAVLSSNDGVIVARSQEVKEMGIPMGIPLFQAKQLAGMREVTLFSSNFPLYRDLSSRVMAALRQVFGPCEVYSIDEAFFSLPASTTVEELLFARQQIMRLIGLPIAIGAAPTKTLAKVASKLAKQQPGVAILALEAWRQQALAYPLDDIWNLGPGTAKTLRQNQLDTPAAFITADRQWVASVLGVQGLKLYDELNGRIRHQLSVEHQEGPQSIASTRSFSQPSQKLTLLESAVTYHLCQVAEKLRAVGLAASRLSIELRPSRHGAFAHQRGTLEVELELPSNQTATLLRAALGAVRSIYKSGVPYKKAGVTASHLVPVTLVPATLFDDMVHQDGNHQVVDMVTDQINERFGFGTLRPGTYLTHSLQTTATLRSPRYTTAWSDIPRVVS